MDLISKDELKAKLDNKDEFKLLFTMGEWHFEAMRIPGSLHVDSFNRAEEILQDINEEIVVYCSGQSCVASRYAYRKLKERGFTKVRRYEGGLSEWEAAGYPVIGEMVK